MRDHDDQCCFLEVMEVHQNQQSVGLREAAALLEHMRAAGSLLRMVGST